MMRLGLRRAFAQSTRQNSQHWALYLRPGTSRSAVLPFFVSQLCDKQHYSNTSVVWKAASEVSAKASARDGASSTMLPESLTYL